MSAHHGIGTNMTQFDSIYTVMPKRENFYVRDPKLQSFGQLLEENSTLPRILYLS